MLADSVFDVSKCIKVYFNIFQHAHALEILSEHLHEGARALDVGSGSGYLTACMALMVSTLTHCIPMDSSTVIH